MSEPDRQPPRRNFWAVVLSGLLLGAGLAASLGFAADDVPSVRTLPSFGDAEVRGITLSTHRGGQEWGSVEAIRPAFTAMREIGAGWVAIHPYASVTREGEVRFRPIPADDPPAYLAVPIREAHALGLRILIKPHLAYWRSGFGWRGEIEFDDDEAWRRFFAGYGEWIRQLAAATRAADGLVVGTELERTISHEDAWRALIAQVRERTAVPLTYGANWDGYTRVPFWDALDAIGIQAYFPLAEEATLDPGTIRDGWSRVMQEMHSFSVKLGRPILFTELGYSRSFRAAVEPWAHDTDGVEAEETQRTCMRIALESIRDEPSVVGAFLWKWFPEPHPVGRNFRLATPEMKQVIRSSWPLSIEPQATTPGESAATARNRTGR